ncbi:MAG: TIR domain-containing protein [Chloroflexi bacterium]|nr:TIR domain-containing protein [Chloroflexota bacterium]
MSQIFISYSRKDLAIAEKIIAALAKDDLEPWIDWKSIPKGETFEGEIRQGIEKAEIFLFLVSPDSVQSDWCNKEINHAVKNGKRILPIVIRDTDPKSIHPEISKRNWIFCRDGQDDFNKAIEEACATIHTDYEWLKYHTKLQLKALDWESGKDNSRLLRGKELREAEQQFANVEINKDHQSTNVQRKYVLTSRKNEELQRRRIIFGLSMFSFIIFVALVITSIQLKISRAQQLGLQAQNEYSNNNLNLAALYAYQSNTTWENNEAKLVMGRLSGEEFMKAVGLLGHKTNALSVAWSPSGQLASGDIDGLVIVWDIQNRTPKNFLYGHTGKVNSLAWSADGKLASGSWDHSVIIWDIENNQPSKVLKGHYDNVNSIAWSPDGRVLASASNDITVIVWNAETGQIVRTLHGNEKAIYALAWSADGKLASCAIDGTIIIWDLDKGKPQRQISSKAPAVLSNMIWSPTGDLVYGTMNGNIEFLNIHTGNVIKTLESEADYSINTIALSPNGILASASQNETIIWDMKTNKPALILTGHTAPVMGLSWFADNKLASAGDETILIWDLQQNKSNPITLVGHRDWVKSVAWSQDGRLASGAWDNKVIVWDIQNGLPSQILNGHTDWVEGVAWSKDGRLASCSDDNSIIIWNLQTGQIAKTLRINNADEAWNDPGGFSSLAWSSDGKLAAGAWNGTVTVWDLNSNKPPIILVGHRDSVTSVAWSPDGHLASGSFDETVILWNLNMEEQNRAVILSGHVDLVDSVAWSSDGRLASGARDGTIIVWDLKQNKPAQKLKKSSGTWMNWVTSVAWSKDGRLASSSVNRLTVIWDLQKGRPAVIIPGRNSYVQSIAWSDSGQLAMGSSDRTIQIADTTLFGSNPCNWIFRNMTGSEWLLYQGISTYQPACPNLSLPGQEYVRFNTWYSGQFFPELFIVWPGRWFLLFIFCLISFFTYSTIFIIKKLSSLIRLPRKVKLLLTLFVFLFCICCCGLIYIIIKLISFVNI